MRTATPLGTTQQAVLDNLPHWPNTIQTGQLRKQTGHTKRAVFSAIQGLKRRGLIHTVIPQNTKSKAAPYQYCHANQDIPPEQEPDTVWMEQAACGPLYWHPTSPIDPLDPADAQYVAEEVCPTCPVLKECGRYVEHLQAHAYGGESLFGAWAGRVIGE